jgi:hypothetical protein
MPIASVMGKYESAHYEQYNFAQRHRAPDNEAPTVRRGWGLADARVGGGDVRSKMIAGDWYAVKAEARQFTSRSDETAAAMKRF